MTEAFDVEFNCWHTSWKGESDANTVHFCVQSIVEVKTGSVD